jgi:hypothetical protein
MKHVWIVLIACACSRPAAEMAERDKLPPAQVVKMAPATSVRPDSVKLDSFSEEELEKNLFGRFFNDRAEFFVIKEPNMKILGSSVRAMTLYYIDGVLCKTKYELVENIAPQLINAYGKFSIMGRDSINSNLLRHEAVLVGDKAKHLNPGLDNYNMVWNRNDKYFIFHADETYGHHYFELVEKMLDYESRLRHADDGMEGAHP